MYNDPDETAPLGKQHVYPKKPWLPFDGVQMGSLKDTSGDIVTPDLPAIDDVYRVSHPDNDSSYLPTILLSANSVMEIMNQMKGTACFVFH